MKKGRRFLVALLLLLGGVLFMDGKPLTAAPARIAGVEVDAAWQLAQSAGSLSYRTELHQFTRPLPTLANVGLSNHEERIYIEGQTDLAEEVMQLKLWATEGNVLGDSDSIEIKVEDGQAMGGTAGQDWEEVGNFTDMFAPNGDPLAFLLAADNIE